MITWLNVGDLHNTYTNTSRKRHIGIRVETRHSLLKVNTFGYELKYANNDMFYL
jgi:hypothetical protein